MAKILHPPFPPMEALSVSEIPVGPEWQYEPKWDGFRCLVFRDGKSLTLQSKSGKPLTRYFPDLVDAVRSIKADRFVFDGEIVVPAGKVFSFDALLQRIHPAESRVEKLAKETPALMIVFDLLADPDGVLIDRSLPARRQRLEAFALKYFAKNGQMRLSPATTTLMEAKKWLYSRRRDTRRHRRQAARHALQLGQPPRHAEDQELSLGRLRGRRLPLQRGQACRRLASARPL